MNDYTIQRCPHDKENPYAQINRDLIRDQSISPECRWLIIYLLSMSDTWSIKVKQLIAHLKPHMGRDKVYKLINEAIEAGYMKKEIDKEGNLNRSIKYFVSENPKFKKSLRSPEIQDPEIGDSENKHYKKEHTPKKEHIEKKQQQAPDGAKASGGVVVFYKCIEKIGLTEKERKALMKYPEEEVKEAVEFATNPKTKIKKDLISTLIWALNHKPEFPKPVNVKMNKLGAESVQYNLESKNWQVEALSKMVEIYSKTPTNTTVHQVSYDDPQFEQKFDELLKHCGFEPCKRK